MLCIGYGRYPPQNIPETCITISSMMTGATFYALFIAYSINVIQTMDSPGRNYKEKVKAVFNHHHHHHHHHHYHDHYHHHHHHHHHPHCHCHRYRHCFTCHSKSTKAFWILFMKYHLVSFPSHWRHSLARCCCCCCFLLFVCFLTAFFTLSSHMLRDYLYFNQLPAIKKLQWNLDITKGQGTGNICSI